MKKIKWYCYVCGETIKKDFYLCALNERTDRVFLMCNKKICYRRVSNNYTILVKVKETK